MAFWHIPRANNRRTYYVTKMRHSLRHVLEAFTRGGFAEVLGGSHRSKTPRTLGDGPSSLLHCLCGGHAIRDPSEQTSGTLRTAALSILEAARRANATDPWELLTTLLAPVTALPDTPSEATSTVPPKCVEQIVNAANGKGQTCLFIAAEAGWVNTVALLLSLGANPWLADRMGGRTPLHAACLQARADVVRCLLDSLPERWHYCPQGTRYVDARTVSGFTALHCAVSAGDLATVQALLEHYPLLSASNRMPSWEFSVPFPAGTTPLHVAATRGHSLMACAIMRHYAVHVSGTRTRSGRPQLDPRLARNNDSGQRAYEVALEHHRERRGLVQVLHPALPLPFYLEGSSGPPTLQSLAAAALKSALQRSLETATQAPAGTLGASGAASTRHTPRGSLEQLRQHMSAGPSRACDMFCRESQISVSADALQHHLHAHNLGGCGHDDQGGPSTPKHCGHSTGGAGCSYDHHEDNDHHHHHPTAHSHSHDSGSCAYGAEHAHKGDGAECSGACCITAGWLVACGPHSHTQELSVRGGTTTHVACAPPSADVACAGSDTSEEDTLCGVCYDNEACVALAGCGHTLCATCANTMLTRMGHSPLTCAFCRGPVRGFQAVGAPAPAATHA